MRPDPIIHDALIYTRNGPQQAAEQLIRDHSALVRRLAWHVHSRMSSAVEIEDLIQIGMIALLEAARNFEERGIPFVPYATMRIRGSMIDELRRVSRMCRSGMANRRALTATRAKLEQQLMRPPNDAEMAEALGLDAMTYHEWVASAQHVQQESFEESYSDSDIWFADEERGADEQLEMAQMTALLSEHISHLSEREALILNLYFVEEMNLHEIGEVMKITSARVCQIKKAALDRLRAMMSD